ncbi:MAG: sugar phosphate isomerase/epimerase [Faecalicoccus sp.]|uniref:sugar phosphate isomerase/epimerase family protein n=1 Tax=Faecalicoccus sp. TaxID=1971758 RepID=UPI002A82DCDB|nr:sugar phosphate isomerase/epimerase [Faecalicoccus sp.]MCI6380862.1 sugar phosphate isomerase/epimerase [Erysipelotrichaceae bacterium]MDY4870681.1 sugar phosphate isomerase/epimerase [Faecalicoccus sp.]
MKLSIISDQVSQNLEEALKIIVKEGYEYVELHNVFGHSIETCTKEEVEIIKHLLNRYHVKVSNIASTLFFLCPLYQGDEVSLFNPGFYSIQGDLEYHLKVLENACWIANELDCPKIRIFPFRWPDNRKGPYGTKLDFEKIIENIKKALDISKKHHVTLMLENCPYSHLPKGKMTLQVVQEINDPYLKLLWDPANSYRAIRENVPKEYMDWSLEEELLHLYPYIGHIHLKNYHYVSGLVKPFVHVPLLNGNIDYKTLVKSIQETCDCILSLEPEVDKKGTLLSMQCLKSLCSV